MILAVATSSPQGSLALSTGEQVTWDKKAMHSELATVKLQELLGSRPLSIITKIAVVNGPGSFTGIRVGVNLARTLAYALNVPAATVNALAILALRQEGEVTVGIEAVREHRYVARYRKEAGVLTELMPPTSQTEAEVLAGPQPVVLEKASTQIQALELLAALGPTKAQFYTWKEVQPLYVRGSEAEEKMRQGLLKPV